MNDRDKRIIELASKGKTPDEIAAEVKLGPTRVRQILSANVPDLREVQMEKLLAQVKDDVEREHALVDAQIEEMLASGETKRLASPYTIITERYGKKMVQELNLLGYNLFRTCQTRRDATMAKLAKDETNKQGEVITPGVSGTVLSTMFGITRDHVYGVLHDRGVRKTTRLTGAKKAERDKKVYQLYLKVGTYGPVAKEFSISQVMVGIIVKQQQEKKDQEQKKK